MPFGPIAAPPLLPAQLPDTTPFPNPAPIPASATPHRCPPAHERQSRSRTTLHPSRGTESPAPETKTLVIASPLRLNFFAPHSLASHVLARDPVRPPPYAAQNSFVLSAAYRLRPPVPAPDAAQGV